VSRILRCKSAYFHHCRIISLWLVFLSSSAEVFWHGLC